MNSMPSKKSSVVVCGMGIISAIGHNVREFSDNLKNGCSGISTMRRRQPKMLLGIPGAEVGGFCFQQALQNLSHLPQAMLEKTRLYVGRSLPGVQMAAIAALQAWRDAALDRQQPDPSALAVVVAGHNINQNYHYERSCDFLDESEYVPPSYALRFMDSDLVATLSSVLGIHGEGFTCGAASASGNAALIQGYRLVESGRASACLIAGPLTALSPVEMQGFYDLGAMGAKKFKDEPAKACRPFDRDHEGFIYGEACACVVLEPRASAERRGAAIWGEILGTAIVLDGNNGCDPSTEGEVRAMRRALDEAGITPAEVDYLNAHGTSSPLGDTTEVQAVKKVFERCLTHLWVNSTKGLTGHCLWSAGVVELIATLVQMKNGFVHPNLNLENPIDCSVRFAGAHSEPVKIETAMSNAFGFGGINTSLIVRR